MGNHLSRRRPQSRRRCSRRQTPASDKKPAHEYDAPTKRKTSRLANSAGSSCTPAVFKYNTFTTRVSPQSSPLCPAAHLGPPPANANQEKTPIVEEFRLLALKGMPDELQDPAEDKKPRGVDP